jgi:hypothetical protein
MFKHRFLLIMGSIVDNVLLGSIEINSLIFEEGVGVEVKVGGGLWVEVEDWVEVGSELSTSSIIILLSENATLDVFFVLLRLEDILYKDYYLHNIYIGLLVYCFGCFGCFRGFRGFIVLYRIYYIDNII